MEYVRVDACISVWVYVCGSEYAEEHVQVFVGGEACLCGQDLGMFYVCQDVCAHACRCIRECVCIFTYAGMCDCAQVYTRMVDYCAPLVSL